jgi:protein-tyrosine phosphatase
MIDLHSHLLHGLDDGPDRIEETLEIIRHLSSFGFTELVPAPHKFHILFNPSSAQVAQKISEIKRSIVKRFTFEYFCNVPLIKQLDNHHEICVTSDGMKVILVEFPVVVLKKEDVEKSLFLLNSAGFAPLIAHVERYGKDDIFWSDVKKKYKVFIQGGVKAFAKPFYDNSRRQLIRLMDAGIIDNLATDIHSSSQLLKVEKAINFIVKEYRVDFRRFFTDSFGRD